MYATIKMKGVEAICLDLVDNRDGFLYLRMVGAEVAVNAIWAKLSARDRRKYGAGVEVHKSGEKYATHINAQKHVTYRTLRSRLQNGMVDLAMIHPILTVTEDNSDGFHLLTYDEGTPAGFFERLNKALSIPLKPEWADWLWTEGRKYQKIRLMKTEKVWEDRQLVKRTEPKDVEIMPISRIVSSDNIGDVGCYQIFVAGEHREAWLHLIRTQLGLQIDLIPQGNDIYLNGVWEVSGGSEAWGLFKGDDLVLDAPSLDWLLVEAREKIGLNLAIKQDKKLLEKGSV